MAPNITPVTSEMASVKLSTRKSRLTSSASCVNAPASARELQTAKARPSNPAAVESTRLSVTNCRNRRTRPAPSASLTAISRRRTSRTSTESQHSRMR